MTDEIDDIDRVQAAMYEAASAEASEKPIRSYLGMSGIGDPCSRKIWYGFRQYTPSFLDGRVKMIFDFGELIEELAIRYLTDAGYRIEGRQTEFRALNGFMAGHCDGIIYGVTKRPHILEIKSASSSRFKAFKTASVVNMVPAYAAQVQCYMAAANLDRALFVVVCKDNSEIYTERVHFDEAAYREIEDKARRIIGSNLPPDRAYSQGDRECMFCSYAGHCWESPYIQRHRTCGTCCHLHFDGLKPLCEKHGKEIRHWGRVCPAYSFVEAVDKVPF